MWYNFLLESYEKRRRAVLFPHCKAIAFRPEVKQCMTSKSKPSRLGLNNPCKPLCHFLQGRVLTHGSGCPKVGEKPVVITALQNSYWSNGVYNEKRQGGNLWGLKGEKNLRGVLTHSSKCFLDSLDFTSHKMEIAGENQVNKENKRFLDYSTCVTNAE